LTLTILSLKTIELPGTLKLIYHYDPVKDAVVNTPAENQTFGSSIWSYEVNYREDSLSRASRFFSKDIVGKTLMDFGCTEGGVLFACHQLGASEITGIELNEWCVQQAIAKAEKANISSAKFFIGDMENKAFLSTLPQVDTVFLLAILDTSNF